MNSRILAIAAAGALLIASTVSAETYNWTYSAVNDRKISDAANWEGQTAPDLTNAETPPDIAFGDGDATNAYPRIFMGDTAAMNANLHIGTLTGSQYFSFRIGPWIASTYGCGSNYLTVNDPSGFYGWWLGNVPPTSTSYYGPTRPGLFVPASESGKAVLRKVDASGRLRILGGGALTVEESRGIGAFEVNGSGKDGTVRFLSSAGPRANPLIVAGTMEAVGAEVENPDSPTEGAWLHLDAADPASLTLSGTDVIAWADTRGNGIVATGYGDDYNKGHCPQLVAVPGTELKAVNFGAFGINANGSTYEPPQDLLDAYGYPTAMKLSEGAKGVREIFYVYEENAQVNGVCYPSVVGPNFSSPTYVQGMPSGWTNRIARLRKQGSLFQATYPEERIVDASEIRIDGQRVSNAYTGDFSRRYHVVSVSLADGAGTGVQNLSLSRDRVGACSFAGFKLAEIVLYTNALTVAERRRNTDYLMRKWLADDAKANRDYGYVKLSSGASFKAVSGTVRIRELDLPAGTTSFVKTGAGKLSVERMYVNGTLSNVPVKVDEGSFEFANSFAPVARTKAPDPDMWLDATQIAAADIVGTEGNETVPVWRDPRGRNASGNVITAEPMHLSSNHPNDAPCAAKFVRDAQNGHPAVDFGKLSAANASAGWNASGDEGCTAYMLVRDGKGPSSTQTSFANLSRTKECFVAFKLHHAHASLFDTGNQGGMDFFHYGESYIYRKNLVENMSVHSAYWTLNGAPVDASEKTLAANTWYVISFSAAEGLPFGAMGIDRGQNMYGGLQVGEVLTYDRALTDGERRDTIAYLMDKWLAAKHPEEDFVPEVKYTVADGSNPVIDSSADIVITELSASSGEIGGAFEKRGDGKVTVRQGFTGLSFSSIDVADGELDLTFGAESVLDRAYFHLDATDEASLTKTGGCFVTTWADTRANGREARVCTGGKFKPGVSPRLETVEINGRELPVVNYGPTTRDAQDGTYYGDATSGHNWYAGNSLFSQTFGELYIVARSNGWLPASGSGSRTRYFDNASGNLSGFFRNSDSNSKIVHTSVQPEVYNGRCWIDGEEVAIADVVPAKAVNDQENFHVTAFVPTQPTPNVSAIGNRGGGDAGGESVGEVLAFATANSDADRGIILAALNKKWLGLGNGYCIELDAISLSKGGTLVLGTDGSLGSVAVATLAGDGSVASPAISGVNTFDIGNAEGKVGQLSVDGDLSIDGVSALAIDCAGDGSVDRLTVGGTLTLPETCAVTFRTSARAPRSLTEEFVIFSAETLVGDVSSWTVTAPDLTAGEVVLSVHDNAVYGKFLKPGMAILVK